MYTIKLDPLFKKPYRKLTEGNNQLKIAVRKAFKLLEVDPKYPSLHSHKVQTPTFGEKWSSRVTGDIRIIWDFDEDNNLIIFVLDIGGHSGSGKVYK